MRFILFLIIFLGASCTLHRKKVTAVDDFNRLLADAREAWKKNTDEKKVDFYFEELVWWGKTSGDMERLAWAYHEWGRFKLSKKKPIASEQYFIKSRQLLIDKRVLNPILAFMNNINLAVLNYEKEKTEKYDPATVGCRYLVNSKKNWELMLVMNQQHNLGKAFVSDTFVVSDVYESKVGKPLLVEEMIRDFRKRQNHISLRKNCTYGVI